MLSLIVRACCYLRLLLQGPGSEIFGIARCFLALLTDLAISEDVDRTDDKHFACVYALEVSNVSEKANATRVNARRYTLVKLQPKTLGRLLTNECAKESVA